MVTMRPGTRVMIRDLVPECTSDTLDVSDLYGKVGTVVERWIADTPDDGCVIVKVRNTRISFHESELLEVYG